MRLGWIITLCVCANAQITWAESWTPMNNAEITAALSEKTYIYADATQVFYASGRTLYNAGRESWRYWAARGDQYCSQWPPGELWSCYDLERGAPGVIRFVAPDGSATEGRLAK